MKESLMTESQLLAEIEYLRKRVNELEMMNANYRQVETTLAENEKNLRTFFNTIDHLLFVLDSNGNILLTNDAVTRKLGYSTDELLGQSVLMVHPPERRSEAGHIVEEMLAGKADYCPVPVITKDGRQIQVETRVVAGKWSGQDVIFGITKDLSDIKASEEKFSKAFQISPALMAISEIESGRYVNVNNAFLQTLGFTREEVIGRTSLELNIFSNANQREKLLERMECERQLRNAEIMVRAKSGEIHYGLFSMDYIQLQDRKLLLTVMNDITERKQAEGALRESEVRWQFALEGAGDGVWDWNAQNNQVFYSKQWKTMLGYADDEIGNSLDDWKERVHPDDLSFVLDEINKHFSGQIPFYSSEHRLLCKNGEYKWILDRGKVIQWTDDKKPLRVIGTHTDITESKQAEKAIKMANEQLRSQIAEIEQLQKELREQALHDPLTDLYNRRYLKETLERELKRVKREKIPLSVIIIDIDNFKKINDTYGHQVGDEFLKKIADMISSNTRGSDIACRYGGEEYLLVMPGTSVKSAASRAEQLRLECAKIQIPYKNKKLSVTLSFGVASFPDHSQEAEDIVIKADKALYKSKRSGRNCITTWDEQMEIRHSKHS